MVHTQDWHARYNAINYPGTRQMCCDCGNPTDRCEDDAIYTDDGHGPICIDCYHETDEYARSNGVANNEFKRIEAQEERG